MVVPGPRVTASIHAIVDYWAEADPPQLHSHFIGWGEPFCFGCGWLAPVRDANTEKALPRAWQTASQWLDRAHLQDHCLGGPGEPANLVMLCHLCHAGMPSFASRGDALQWVFDRPDGDNNLNKLRNLSAANPTATPAPSCLVQLWTDERHSGRYGTTGETMTRSRMHYLEWLRTSASRKPDDRAETA